MSAKTQFLSKLQALEAVPPCTNKSEADIAAFCLRITQLQKQITTWLAGTGIETHSVTAALTDLLVGRRAFSVPGIVLGYRDRTVKLLPLFLYGQDVTGCMEVTLHVDGAITPLYRLFMRYGKNMAWSGMPAEALAGPVHLFDEERFFSLITGLLP